MGFLKMVSARSLGIFLIFTLSACGAATAPAPSDSTDGNPSMTLKQSPLPAGDSHCPSGGVSVQTGIDDNKNSVLDAGEVDAVEYVCHGAAGAQGQQGNAGATGPAGTATVATALSTGDANCPYGGTKFATGTTTTYACNGAAGAQGQQGNAGATGPAGTTGADGLSSLLAISAESAGTNCVYGGKKITSGLDANKNGALDTAEAANTAYLCNIYSSSPPSAPAGVSVSISSGQVTMNWQAVSGALFYNVYYGASAGVTTTSDYYSTAIFNTSKTVTGLTDGTMYYFIVTAVSAGGESPASVEIGAKPIAAPSGVGATPGNGQLSISWNAVASATSYNLYWASVTGVTKTGGAKVSGVTSPHTLTGLTNGATYYFIVTALNSTGEGSASAESSATPLSVVAIAAGGAHTLAIRSNGGALAWGDNFYGQLGDGTSNDRTIPVSVGNLTGVTAVAGGGSHSLALKSDGTVRGWGWNGYGQLGDNTTVSQVNAPPVQATGLTGVAAIAGADANHSIALKSDGTVWGWGDNLYGQLGDGTTTQRSAPVQVSPLSGATAVAAGTTHTLALKSDGTVWGWGRNANGQLGNGATANNQNTPVQMGTFSDITAIAGGYEHSIALKADGTVWAMGYNDFGQLGNATVVGSSSPVQVCASGETSPCANFLAGIVAVAADRAHSMALKNDGTVWAWGQNGNGEVGDGSTANRTTPVQVGGLTGVVAIAGGDYHSVALKSDGTLWAWGRNADGQLGDGTMNARYTPVQVGGISSGSAILAPSGVTATAGSAQTTISWSSVAGATSYNVYWSTTPGVNQLSGAKITGVASPYTHTGLTVGTRYYYMVSANGATESVGSFVVTARPQ